MKYHAISHITEFVTLTNYVPESEFEAAREKRENAKVFSHKGAGRPTKKDRRDIERLLSE